MEIRKIVVGTDFSPEANRALQQAMEIARHTGAELTLLHVGAVLDMVQDVPRLAAPAMRDYERALKAQLGDLRRQLEELRQRVSGQGVTVSHMITDGFADTGLCAAVDELGADLLVTGTHGHTGVRRFLMGSVAARVVRLCNAPVLVARGEAPRGGYRRILVPTDFSEAADAALETALQVASPQAEIVLLHCWSTPPLAPAFIPDPGAAGGVMQSVRSVMSEGASAAAARLIARHRQRGPAIDFVALETSPAQGILEQLESAGRWDLVVLGSHGRRGLQRWLVGSVAELTVRHAPCSALVVRSGKREE
jgi:nucleotide-binding universal stress UspA family protein